MPFNFFGFPIFIFPSWMVPIYPVKHLFDISGFCKFSHIPVLPLCTIIIGTVRACSTLCSFHALYVWPDVFYGCFVLLFAMMIAAYITSLLRFSISDNWIERSIAGVFVHTTTNKECPISLKFGFVGCGRKTEQNPHNCGEQQLQKSATGVWLWVLWPYREVRRVKNGNIPKPTSVYDYMSQSSLSSIKAKQHLHVSLFHTGEKKQKTKWDKAAFVFLTVSVTARK